MLLPRGWQGHGWREMREGPGRRPWGGMAGVEVGAVTG